jgi:hypothetical protein
MYTHLVPNGQRAIDPGIFSEALLTPHRVHHDVRPKALDLETPWWVDAPGRLSVAVVRRWTVAQSKNVPAGSAKSVTVSR